MTLRLFCPKRLQEGNDSRLKPLLLRRVDLTLPKHQHLPTIAAQLSLSPLIPRRIPLKLGGPVASSRRWHSTPSATVQVPETAVDIDNFHRSGKNHIGTARQGTNMQAVTISERMYKSTHSKSGGISTRIKSSQCAPTARRLYRRRISNITRS